MPGKRPLLQLVICLATIILMSQHVLLQAQYVDTLDWATKLHAEQDFTGAATLLRAYHKDHNDFASLRMLAETYYWQQDFKASEQTYRLVIARFPAQYRTHLELARVCIARSAPGEARNHLKQFLAFQPAHAEANYLTAIAYYWQGNFSKALRYVDLTLGYAPDHSGAAELRKNLKTAMAAELDIRGSLTADDQPLDVYGFHAGYGMYRSTLLAPRLEVDIEEYSGGIPVERVPQIRLSNTFTWWQAGIQLTAGTGVIPGNPPAANNTWQMELRKIFSRGYTLSTSARKQPYLWTLRSIQNARLYTTYQAAFARTGANHYQMELAYIHHAYAPHDLQQRTAYGWILSPPLRLGVLHLNAGYSFSYADADDNLFLPLQSLEEILQDYDPEAPIPGIYDPFYTPEDHRVHAALANMTLKIDRFTLSANASAAIHATADNPYFYLDMRGGDLFIARDFYRERYTPVTLDSRLRCAASENVAVSVSYRYQKSLFYSRHQAAVGLDITLIGT